MAYSDRIVRTPEIIPPKDEGRTFTFRFCEILSRVSHADCSVLSSAELPIALRGASPEVVEDLCASAKTTSPSCEPKAEQGARANTDFSSYRAALRRVARQGLARLD